MKFTLIRYLFIIPLFAACQSVCKVHVSYTNSYCGGARPTPQITEKYNTPKDFSNSKLKLAGKKSYLLTTDSLGFVSHKLQPGKYKVFFTKEKIQGVSTNYDPACEKMTQLSYGELEVLKNKKDYTLSLHFPCNLCEPHDKP